MAIVLDPTELTERSLEGLVSSLRADLKELLEGSIRNPRGPVLNPESLRTADELVGSAIALLERPGHRDREALANEANLAYAVLLAGIDLVKSHTDVPKVPRGPSART